MKRKGRFKGNKSKIEMIGTLKWFNLRVRSRNWIKSCKSKHKMFLQKHFGICLRKAVNFFLKNSEGKFSKKREGRRGGDLKPSLSLKWKLWRRLLEIRNWGTSYWRGKGLQDPCGGLRGDKKHSESSQRSRGMVVLGTPWSELFRCEW